MDGAPNVGGDGVYHSVTDPVFGDLDWNDNTPILEPLPSADNVTSSYMANNSTNMSPSKLISAGASPMPGLLYSPEDTLNNDFFYDDEFTVPFDANLSDKRLTASLLDSEDINDFLSLSKEYAGDADPDDNNGWHMPKMVVSKSDSCLYQADGEFSGSEQNMSQELSTSEKDCASSSELSDFRAEPLFSPLPQPSPALQEGATQALSGSSKIELSESCENQYNYDWRANKNQYMISFDKQCGKQYSSDESSFHESVQGPWQHKSYTSQVSWCSLASKNTGESSNDDGHDESQHRFCSLSQPDAQELTTWQRLKQQASHVTWATLKKAHKEVKKEAAAATLRSKSVQDFSEQVTEHSIATVDCAIGGASEDSVNQEHSTKTLLELFNRMRSHSSGTSGESLGIGLDCNEAMISPTSLHRLTGTWSMSTISSTQSHQVNEQFSPTLPPTPATAPAGLVSWNTFQNLHSDRLVKVDMPDSITSDRVNSRTFGSHLETGTQFDMANFATQAGSGILTESRMYGPSKRQVENGTQYSFYANVRDCGIQTSWDMQNEGFVKKSRITVALQTSFDKRQRPQMNEMATSVILLKTAHERLSSSVIGLPLPDLSFLGKVTCTPRNGKLKDDCTITKKTAKSQTLPKADDTQAKNKSSRRRDTRHRAQSQQSTSLESSSSGGYPSRSRNSINMIANASFCSSSSSGIDPGSSTCDSQNHLHRMADLGDWSDSNSEAGPGSLPTKTTPAGKAPQPRVHVHKVVGNVCSQCNDKSKTMVISHPVARQKRNTELKSLDYLQVSPTHPPKSSPVMKVAQKRPRSMIPVINRPKSRLPIPEKKQQQLFTCSRSQSQPDSLDEEAKLKLPLKSCLVKRTNKRDRRSIMMKHRSWSDPRDALVMKHSQEGQVRYQLIPSATKQTCDKAKDEKSKIPTKSWVSTPQKEEHTNIAIQLSETLSKAKLTPTPHSASQPEAVKPKKVPPPPPPKPPRHLIKDPKPIQVPSPVAEQPRTSEESVESPEQQIPLPNCGCLLQSSSDSGGSGDSMSRAKKSVSFSERVSYHSPYTSPHQSPKKPHVPRIPGATEENRSDPLKTTKAENVASAPIPVPTNSTSSSGKMTPLEIDTESVCSSASSEGPPADFIISPTHSPPITQDNIVDCLVWAQKKELVVRVVQGAEAVINHFQDAKDSEEKVKLGNSKEHPEMAQLVVEHLVPAVYALLMDGLNPYTSSCFGRVKNNVWSIVELTAKQGSGTMLMCGFVKDMKKMRFLNTPWLKFNAFIFCLLNHHALELWLLSLYGHRVELSKHYSVTSFMRLSMACTSGKELWADLSTAIQPLSQLPFKLQYDCDAIKLADCPSQDSSRASSQQGSSTDSPCKSSRSLDSVRLGDCHEDAPPKGVTHSLSEQILLKTSEKTKDFVKERMKGAGKTKELLKEKAVLKTQQYLVNASSMLLKNMVQGSRNDAITWRSEPVKANKLQRLFSREKSKSLDGCNRMKSSEANCNSASVDGMRRDDHSNPESVSSSTECAPTQYSLSSLRSDSSDSSLHPDHRDPVPPPKKSRFRKTLGSFGPTLIKLFDNVLLDTQGKENSDRGGKKPKPIGMSQSVPLKLSEQAAREEDEQKGTAQIILDGDAEVRRRPGAADLRKRRDRISKEQQRSVTALCSYSSMDSDELSFEKGSTLTVLEDVDSEWLRCRLADSHGLVHRACVL